MLTLAVVLLFGGAVLLALEILVIPGFGLFGVTGLVVIVVGLGIVMAAPGISGTIAFVTALFLVVVGIFAILFFIRRRKPSDLILEERLSGSAAQDFNQLLGTTGVALTPLRPAGTAQLAGKRWAVVTEGEYVASGTDVIVIQVEGQRILVKKA